jgi:hypothetical protein
MVHRPLELHDSLLGQVPHEPPQPSLPHCRPAQFGAQVRSGETVPEQADKSVNAANALIRHE